jgi:16S rRNA (uracil1498-N3)-methyltransferase
MPIDRYYSPLDLIAGAQLSLQDQEFHHLVHVTRNQCGDNIELVNGRGALANATIHAIKKKEAILTINDVVTKPPPQVEVVLAQAIPRMNRLDFILEKGTELGMTQLWLFPAKESERGSFTEHQLARMQTVTVAAMKQCGRFYLPSIQVMPPLAQWKAPEWPSYFGDVSSAAPAFSESFESMRAQKGVVFYIGPESGFTSDEEKILKRLNAQGVKLHPNILRTDTAALAALSLMSHCLMSNS